MKKKELKLNDPAFTPDKSAKGKKHIITPPKDMSPQGYSLLLSDVAKDAGINVEKPDWAMETAEQAKHVTKEVRAFARELVNPGGVPAILTEEVRQSYRGKIFTAYFERLEQFDKDQLHFLLTTYLADVTKGNLGL